MSRPKTHTFIDLSGAISEEIRFNIKLSARLKVVTLEFSDVLTQDLFYYQRLDKHGNVLEQYTENPALSPTATRFTWIPPYDAMHAGPGEYFRFVFANNDGETLLSPESNAQYEITE